MNKYTFNAKENKEIYYSPYGYISVDKNEMNSPDKMIKFTKQNLFSGTIEVRIYIYSL